MDFFNKIVFIVSLWAAGCFISAAIIGDVNWSWVDNEEKQPRKKLSKRLYKISVILSLIASIVFVVS